MVITNRIQELFDDARVMHNASLERLNAGDVRDAAEKAWCATKRSTDGLILARTGHEPETTSGTTEGLLALAKIRRHLRPRSDDFSLASVIFTVPAFSTDIAGRTPNGALGRLLTTFMMRNCCQLWTKADLPK